MFRVYTFTVQVGSSCPELVFALKYLGWTVWSRNDDVGGDGGCYNIVLITFIRM